MTEQRLVELEDELQVAAKELQRYRREVEESTRVGQEEKRQRMSWEALADKAEQSCRALRTEIKHAENLHAETLDNLQSEIQQERNSLKGEIHSLHEEILEMEIEHQRLQDQLHQYAEELKKVFVIAG